MTKAILTTHVGSLVRPPELIAFLLKQQSGESYNRQAFDECLRMSVEDVVRKQVETGIDIVSDGEFGKTISWSRYILERLSGFTEREDPRGAPASVAGKDRRDFKDFYEEYEAEKGVVGMGKQATKFRASAITGPATRSSTRSSRRWSSTTLWITH